jgi:hypothetical protein
MLHHLFTRRNDLKPEFTAAEGQVGQESNLQPAVLETQSGVSGGIGTCRQMPPCPLKRAVICR